MGYSTFEEVDPKAWATQMAAAAAERIEYDSNPGLLFFWIFVREKHILMLYSSSQKIDGQVGQKCSQECFWGVFCGFFYGSSDRGVSSLFYSLIKTLFLSFILLSLSCCIMYKRKWKDRLHSLDGQITAANPIGDSKMEPRVPRLWCLEWVGLTPLPGVLEFRVHLSSQNHWWIGRYMGGICYQQKLS